MVYMGLPLSIWGAIGIDRTMEFRQYLEMEEMTNEGLDGAARRGLMAGLLGSSLALSPVLSGHSDVVSPFEKTPKPEVKVPRDQELVDELKDSNRYWDSDTMKELVKAARAGDEWAVREIAWPKGHPFHKMGRPFFRNDKPHPNGLFPYSGH